MPTLNGTEIVYVIGVQNHGPSAEYEQTTTQAIANLGGGGGGGGGPTSTLVVNSGTTSAEAMLSQIVIFNSATVGNKTVPIPSSTGSNQFIWIFDFEGNAGTYPITAVPESGSITGVNEVYTNNGSIILLDTSVGWISV